MFMFYLTTESAENARTPNNDITPVTRAEVSGLGGGSLKWQQGERINYQSNLNHSATMAAVEA